MKAVIDMGTNTFHLLIGEVNNNPKEVIFRKTIPVKLGEEGGISRGEIIPTAYHRGIEALQEFREIINNYPVNNIKATATAAIRDAQNGANFIQDIFKLTQIKVDIIDGQEEALYIYRGALAANILSERTSLILDIGGGSAEFIIANNQEIFWKDSFRLGAARLLSDFYHSDPLNEMDLKSIENHLQNTLTSFFKAYNTFKPTELIGTAGAFDSYRDIILSAKEIDLNLINYNFDFTEFIHLIDKLICSTHQERLLINGLIPLRTDMILMSSVMVKSLLNSTQITNVSASAYSLKEGLLFYP